MASNTLSIYLTSPLYEQVKKAEADGKFKAKEVCTLALEAAVRSLDEPWVPSEADGQELQQAMQQAMQDDRSGEVVPQTSYEIKWFPQQVAAQAYIDNVAEQGAVVQSMTTDVNGQVGLLVAWPS